VQSAMRRVPQGIVEQKDSTSGHRTSTSTGTPGGVAARRRRERIRRSMANTERSS
jgi:hypothetical protein